VGRVVLGAMYWRDAVSLSSVEACAEIEVTVSAVPAVVALPLVFAAFAGMSADTRGAICRRCIRSSDRTRKYFCLHSGHQNLRASRNFRFQRGPCAGGT